MKYTVKQFGMRLDGKFGLCGEISGLTTEDVVNQIKSLQTKHRLAKENASYCCDAIAIFDETGKQYRMLQFIGAIE